MRIKFNAPSNSIRGGLLKNGGGGRNCRGKGSPGGGRGVGCCLTTGTVSTFVVTGGGVVSFSGKTVEFGSVIHDGRVNPRPRPAISINCNCQVFHSLQEIHSVYSELDGFGSPSTTLSYENVHACKTPAS